MGGKAILKVGYSCNNNCLICHCIDKKRYHSLSTEHLKKKILLCKKQGMNFVLFSGGEPTIRKDFLILARFIKDNRMSFGLITNARVLSYKKYVERLCKLSLKYVYATLYSSKPEIHNRLTGAESFNQTLQGIKNIAKRKEIELIVNIPVTRVNADGLKESVDALKRTGVKNIKFSFMDIKGNALKNLDKTILPISNAADKVQKAMLYAEREGLKVMASSFPPCLIKGFERNIQDLEGQQIFYISEAFEDNLFPVDHKDKAKTERCKNCEKNKNCIGVDKLYLYLFGDSELAPIIKKSNSAFFALAKEISQKELKKIIVKQKEILLENKKKFYLFSYKSNDFFEEEIETIKDKEQVYTEKGQKCRKESTKKNFYVVSGKEDSAFCTSAENKLKSIKGKVLDIGCGEMYFYPVFKMLSEKGQIEYIGIDPKKTSIKGKNMRFLQAKFEDTCFKTESFDSILMFGSYNHVEDEIFVLKEAYRILKHQGTLIIAEDEPVIILGKEKSSGKKEFEHYGNYSAFDAEKNLIKTGFKIKAKRPVSKKTGNRWLIICIKP